MPDIESLHYQGGGGGGTSGTRLAAIGCAGFALATLGIVAGAAIGWVVRDQEVREKAQAIDGYVAVLGEYEGKLSETQDKLDGLDERFAMASTKLAKLEGCPEYAEEMKVFASELEADRDVLARDLADTRDIARRVQQKKDELEAMVDDMGDVIVAVTTEVERERIRNWEEVELYARQEVCRGVGGRKERKCTSVVDAALVSTDRIDWIDRGRILEYTDVPYNADDTLYDEFERCQEHGALSVIVTSDDEEGRSQPRGARLVQFPEPSQLRAGKWWYISFCQLLPEQEG